MLSPNLSSKIARAVRAFHHLEKLIISQPTAVEQFPHLSSISILKLLDIPVDCNDWQWLPRIENLSEFEISVQGTNAQSGSLHVRNRNADLNSVADVSTVSSLMKVMSHLPMELISIKVSILGTATDQASLKIDNEEVILSNVTDDNIMAVFACVLSHLNVPLTQEAGSISGSGTNPCSLSVDSKKAELIDVRNEGTSHDLKVLGNLHENMLRKVRGINVS